VFFSRCLGVDLFSDHLNDLLTDNFIVQVESLETRNQLTGVGYVIFGDFLGIFFAVMYEQVLKLFNLFQQSDGIDLSRAE
jgi:hypothetical protein